MTNFPINIDLEGKDCLVVGGGNIAYRKIRSLLKAKAKVSVVTKELLIEGISSLNIESLEVREVNLDDIDNRFLVISATDSSEVNKIIYQKCKEQNKLINSVDDTDNSNFIFPAIVDRGDLKISISTSGASPFLAIRVKGIISKLINSNIRNIMPILRKFREKWKKSIPEDKKRHKILKESANLVDLEKGMEAADFQRKLKKMEKEI